MTVKGPHVVKGPVVPMLPLDEQPPSLTLTHTPNHRSANHNQQAKPHANGTSRSPPNDSTLNHYRSESRDSVRDGQAKHTPVSNSWNWDSILKLKKKNEEEVRLFIDCDWWIYFNTAFFSLFLMSSTQDGKMEFNWWLFSPDRTRLRHRRPWTREKNERTTGISIGIPRWGNWRRCARAGRAGTGSGTEKGGKGKETGKGSSARKRRGTVNRTYLSYLWWTIGPVKTSRGQGARRNWSILEARPFPVLFYLSCPR